MKRTVLTPSYYKHFKCIGTACEDTCCQSWTIIIDKKNYKKLKNHSKLSKLMRKKIIRNRDNADDHAYAKIQLNEKKLCSFLDEKKLCSIQLEFGEEYLSDTCALYPRTFNEVNDQLEICLTLSCPEVARIILLNRDTMEFDERIEEFNMQRNMPMGKAHEEKTLRQSNKYFWKLRIFTIDVLQTRDYALWERLVMLGLFYNKTQELINQSKACEIPNIINSYTMMLKDKSIKNYVKDMPEKVTFQMELLKELADERIFLGVTHEPFIECYKEFLIGIHYDIKDTVENIGERYLRCYEDYYLPFMKDHEYILENYLVNYVFKTLFPLNKEKTFFDCYIIMVLHYALIKMLLIGISGFHKENFNETHIIEMIYSFSRAVEHNITFIRHAYDLIKKNNMDTMAYMAILIKN